MGSGEPSARRREWRVNSWGRGWTIIRSADLRPGEHALPVPAWFRDTLVDAAADPIGHFEIFSLFAFVFGPSEYEFHDWPALAERLYQELRCGNLLLPAPTSRSREGAGSGGAAAPAPKPPQPRDDKSTSPPTPAAAPPTLKKLTWVAIRLVTADNKPVAGERYRIVLPDGSKQEGTLNSSGEAWIEDTVPGNCQISFPDIHSREWSS